MTRPSLSKFARNGSIPKELPFTFTSEPLASVVAKKQLRAALSLATKSAKDAASCVYSIPKGLASRRHMSLPNPALHLLLMNEIITNWRDIRKHIERSPLGLSTPVIRGQDSSGARYFLPKVPRSRLFLEHLKHSSRFQVLLEFDVSNFYPSIYTHSLEWAFVGRDQAKAELAKFRQKKPVSALYTLGSTLDRQARALKSQETIGLPVGPDSSFVLAEAVAARIDLELASRLASLNSGHGIVGYRYYDDYSLYFSNELDARRALDVIAEVLSVYHLSLNETKTRIARLPVPFRDDWTHFLASFDFGIRGDGEVDMRRLNHYFSEAFRLQSHHSGEGVLNYALSRFLPKALTSRKDNSIGSGSESGALVVPSSYSHTFVALLCQTLITRPETAARVFAVVRHYKLAAREDPTARKILESTLHSWIASVGLHRHHELIWALTFATYFNLNMSKAWLLIAESRHPLVVLAAIDYKTSHKSSFRIHRGWRELAEEPEQLYTANWLLAYEGTRRGWLNKGSDIIAGDPFFEFLRKHNVAFYRSGLSIESSRQSEVTEGLRRMGIGNQSVYAVH